MRSSTIVRTNASASNVGSTTVVPPRPSWTSSCELQPVTWNSGTETRLRSVGPSARSMPITRIAVSTLDRKLPWVVRAPLGRPVVPLV